jgi:hypothetical protein
MTKVFFRKNPTSGVWEYGTFKADGITPDIELTVPDGEYKRRWQTVNSIVQLTIVNVNNSSTLAPFDSMPITEVASDLIGTPYANRAAFEAATNEFFDSTETVQIVDSDGSQSDFGVACGCVDAVLSDTVDLAHPGYFEPRLLAGNIKVTDMYDNVSTLAFDLKELSRFKVKRIWLTGTTADMGIKIYYK